MSDILPEVYLARHGETDWSLSGLVTSNTDIPLTDRGECDAQEMGTLLQGVSFVQVLTRPLQRAQRTAQLAGFGDCAQPDPDLMEWDYGTYEGRRTAEIQAERPGWRLFEDGCPEGETLQAVSARAECVIDRSRGQRGNALIFAHRDIMHILTARWLSLPFKRGLIGTYRHMSEAHLGRYCSEFDLRYNTREMTDGERAAVIVKGMEGKRLTYRRVGRLPA